MAGPCAAVLSLAEGMDWMEFPSPNASEQAPNVSTAVWIRVSPSLLKRWLSALSFELPWEAIGVACLLWAINRVSWIIRLKRPNFTLYKVSITKDEKMPRRNNTLSDFYLRLGAFL